MSLDKLIKSELAALNLPVNRMAREAGVPQPVLYRFLKNQRTLRLDTVERLCVYLGLELRKK